MVHRPRARVVVPSLTPEPHPSERQYVRSFMIMRIGSGLLAFLLPLLLVGIGWWLDDDSVPLSLSEYYYSGRGRCSSACCVRSPGLPLGVQGHRALAGEHPEHARSARGRGGGVSTGAPRRMTDLTPLQEELGESFVETVRFLAAAAFIGSLAVINLSSECGKHAELSRDALAGLLASGTSAAP